MNKPAAKNTYEGIALALLAVIIWSGNFVVARGVIKQIPPISLNFYRWATATVLLFPFAYKQFKTDWTIIRKSWHYLFWVGLTGVALFNSFVYIGAHYTTAINLALIGTTSSPIMSIILARIFLNEKIGWQKLAGITLCLSGILFLISKGNFENLLHFRFTKGDAWVLLAAFFFAVYNTLVKKKPAGISSLSFLFSAFAFGTILLIPAFFWEMSSNPPVAWDLNLILIILYLGIGTSVIAFLSWNISISRLGAGRTALFGNLIPVFSSIEAAIILHEDFNFIHVISMFLVFAGILLANWAIIFRRSQ